MINRKVRGLFVKTKNDSDDLNMGYGLINTKFRGFCVKCENMILSHLKMDCGLINKKSRGFLQKDATDDQKHSVLYYYGKIVLIFVG